MQALLKVSNNHQVPSRTPVVVTLLLRALPVQPALARLGRPGGEGEEGAPGEVLAHQLALGGREHVVNGVEFLPLEGSVPLEAARENGNGVDEQERGEQNECHDIRFIFLVYWVANGA